MISLYKLERLPRHQRLRKICKIFAETETRLEAVGSDNGAVGFHNGAVGLHNGAVGLHNGAGGLNNGADGVLRFCAEAAELLAGDSLFPPEVRAVFERAVPVFREAASNPAAASTDLVAALVDPAAGPTDPAAGPTDPARLRRSLNTLRHILLAETGRSQADWDFIDQRGQLDPAARRPFPGMLVYLEDIRSPFNVGAMFRTAESFGAEQLFLSPLCADPRHPRAARSAMGCVDLLPWERRDFFTAPGAEIAPPDCPLFALETGGTPLHRFEFPPRGLLIAGSEELGVSPPALAAADASLGRVSIPCYGAKGSLNVSTAFGIVMQAWAQALASPQGQTPVP
jgi:TrmH family RNA methyltransferase